MAYGRAVDQRPELDDDPRLGILNELIGLRLRRVQNMLSRSFLTEMHELNLRSGVFSALAMIEANPGISQGELAKMGGFDRAVAVAILDILERKGWARRERDAKDRRRYNLHMNEQGGVALMNLFNIARRNEQIVRQELSAEEVKVLVKLLDRIHVALCGEAAEDV